MPNTFVLAQGEKHKQTKTQYAMLSIKRLPMLLLYFYRVQCLFGDIIQHKHDKREVCSGSFQDETSFIVKPGVLYITFLSTL